MKQLLASVAILVFVSAPTAWLVYYLFGLYKNHIYPARAFAVLNISFESADLSDSRFRTLALVSFLSLFLEMLMIRWVSSEIRVFAYLKNFVLVACFLGFGLGCYLCRRRVHLIATIAPLLLLTIVLKSPLRRLMAALPQLLGGGIDVHMWGVPAAPTSWSGVILATVAIVPLFVIAMAFVPMGFLSAYGKIIGGRVNH